MIKNNFNEANLTDLYNVLERLAIATEEIRDILKISNRKSIEESISRAKKDSPRRK